MACVATHCLSGEYVFPEVMLRAEDVSIIEYEYVDQTGELQPDYRYRCPLCGIVEVEAASPAKRAVLDAAGCKVLKVAMPDHASADIITVLQGPMTENEVYDHIIDLNQLSTYEEKV